MKPYLPHDHPLRVRQRNATVLWRFAAVLGLCLGLAGLMPTVLFPALLSKALLFAALGAGLAAFANQERVTAPYLTGWDLTAWFAALGVLAAGCVDPAAVELVLRDSAMRQPDTALLRPF